MLDSPQALVRMCLALWPPCNACHCSCHQPLPGGPCSPELCEAACWHTAASACPGGLAAPAGWRQFNAHGALLPCPP